MAPKGRQGAKGGQTGGGGGGTTAVSLADLVTGGNALSGLGGRANASSPAAMPTPPGAPANDVLQSLMLMQAMGAGGGGKTTVSLSPLEVMQLRTSMQQQQREQQQQLIAGATIRRTTNPEASRTTNRGQQVYSSPM